MNPVTVFRSLFSRSRSGSTESVAERERKRRIALAQRPPVCANVVKLPSIKKRTNVLQFGAYGDMFYIIADKSSMFDCWSCEPYITFAKSADNNSFPRTDMRPSRHFIGAGAYVDQKQLVVANFQVGSRGATREKNTVNIYVYHVEDDFTCTLLHTYTFDADDCCGSGFQGRLCSLDVSHHAVVFGDLSNNPHFSFGAVTIPAEGSNADVVALHRPPLLYDRMEDVFFKPDGTYCSARACAIGDNALVLLLRIDDERIIAFERVVILPFELGAISDKHISCVIECLKCISTETGDVERLLVRVTIEQERGGNNDGQGESEEESDGTRAVAFLLQIPTNEVVCMSVLRGPYGLCAVSADGQSIVQLRRKA